MTKPIPDLQPYADQLQALPFVKSAAPQLPKGRGEPLLTLHVAGERKKRTLDLAILRTHLSKAEAERWIGKAKSTHHDRPLILFAPYVSTPMGARLREAGLFYVDQAGNLFLALGSEASKGNALVALIEGKRATRTIAADAAWRAPSYQVLLALLIEPQLLTAPVRTIATQAGVSTSPVLQVQKKLVQERFAVSRKGRSEWTPHGQRDARAFWLHGYHTTLRPHLVIGRFRPRSPLSPEALEKEVVRALKGRCAMRWGGAAAADRLDGYYRGDRTVVHLQDGGLSLASVASMLRMLPDPEGPLLVLRTPGPCALNSPDPTTIHPLLAWAELFEEGHDRASQAAQHLAESLLGESDAHR